MRFGLRLRFAVWLLAALLPVGLLAFSVFGRMENEVMDRISVDLSSVQRAESARIEDVLARYTDGARRLARRPATIALVGDLTAAEPTSGAPTEPGAAPTPPLDLRIGELAAAGEATMSHIDAIRLVDPDNRTLVETPGFHALPDDGDLVERVSVEDDVVFGPAHLDASGNARVRVAAAITTDDLRVIGVLLVENDLDPVLDIVRAHNGRSTGSDAFLVQAHVDGRTELLVGPDSEAGDATRFTVIDHEQNRVVPAEMAVRSVEGFVTDFEFESGDRSVIAAQALDGPYWGLMISVERADALEPILDEVRSLKGAALLGVLVVLVGWAGLLDPVARRLRRLAEGAERVASGDYESPLDDRTSDEIGTVAKSIDRLATDLAADIAVRTDIEQRLRYQATHDPLTGLHNRQFATSLMRDLARVSIEQGSPPKKPIFSLLFLDLDRFKAINDGFGHAVGDAVLEQSGRRLVEVVGDYGTVARWGGDEFVIVLPQLGEASARALAANVEEAFASPMIIERVAHDVAPSVGSATFRTGDSVGELLRSADQAMFLNKQRRRETSLRGPEALRSVERALDLDLVEVVFQPLVAGRGDSLVLHGAEALVRVKGSDGEPLAPGQFLSAIEGTRVARDLDRRVMELALEHGAGWIHDGFLPSDFRISVNCSHALLSDRDTPDFVASTLVVASLLPTNLMLEIAEPRSDAERANLARLHRLGVRIAVDDVDVSRSELDGLFEGGASVAKVDQRLSAEATTSHGEEHDVSALVSMYESLGYDVIAENVETAEQYALMRELGVSEFQGYLFAQPLTVTAFAERFCTRIGS